MVKIDEIEVTEHMPGLSVGGGGIDLPSGMFCYEVAGELAESSNYETTIYVNEFPNGEIKAMSLHSQNDGIAESGKVGWIVNGIGSVSENPYNSLDGFYAISGVLEFEDTEGNKYDFYHYNKPGIKIVRPKGFSGLKGTLRIIGMISEKRER